MKLNKCMNMAGYNLEYDFYTPKELRPVQLETRVLDAYGKVWNGPGFPMDSEARVIYHSRMGGFVPPEVAIDTILSNPFHYGAAGFEGVRILRTMYGDGFVGLEDNTARLIFTSLALRRYLIEQTMQIMNDSTVISIEHTQRTPQEFFDDARRLLREGKNIELTLKVNHSDGHSDIVKIPIGLKVQFDDGSRDISMKDMHTIICALAFTNGLARAGPYPANEFTLILAGYFRPFFWISGEQGLKIPTVVKVGGKLVEKPMFFGVATLPWERYLDAEGYNRGLDALIAPFPRIDGAMPVAQKISGCYVNPARNLLLALELGYDEILTVNHNDEIVEGSAENIVVLMTNKKTGAMRAYFPPLSSNILAGTNRNRVLRILEDGITCMNKQVELVMEAPKRTHVLDSLRGKTEWEVSALVMMGTGVGLIHARSITDNPELIKWMALNELRSEDTIPDPITLRRLARANEEDSQRYLINDGQKHPFVHLLQQLYINSVLAGKGARITPAYAMDYDALERLSGVPMGEWFGSAEKARDFRAKVDGGYFNERVNGVTHRTELETRFSIAKAAVCGAVARSMEKRCNKV